MPDLGDTVTLRVRTRDSSGVLGAVTSVVFVVTLPDGTTSTPSTVNPSTGVYEAYYTPGVAGTFSWVATATGGVVGSGGMVLEDTFTVSSMSAIVSVVEAQKFLGEDRDSIQDEVRFWLGVASDAIELRTRRTWRRQSVTETFDGGKTSVSLRRTPVVAITSVTESGTAVASGGWVFDANAKVLYRGTTAGSQSWLPGVQNVSVTYVCGAENIPQVVIAGTLITTRLLWAQRTGGGRRSQADDFADPTDMLPRPIQQALDALAAPGF